MHAVKRKALAFSLASVLAGCSTVPSIPKIARVIERDEIKAPFDAIWIDGDSVKVKGWSTSGVGRIPSGGPDIDDNSEWPNVQAGGIGDILRTKGGQLNLYWEVLDVRHDMVKFRQYGHILRIGPVDETYWVRPYEQRRTLLEAVH